VLQNREIIRLGDTRIKKIDCRIIAATNQNLKMLVKDGTFREDLFYRLNVFPIVVPPLRDRRSDIALLANSIIKKLGHTVTLSPAALKKLLDYAWPGNVRELENVIQRALILCDGKKVLPHHLILDEDAGTSHLAGTLKEIEMNVLLKRLAECNQNRTQTAASLGVSVRWVQLKLKEIENMR
jgi:transcriptional regulator with PAS, ATPase and Fis domain